ncbi:MAG: Rieske 2Fe-2S domain-containing protein [bacterium]
MTDSGAKDRMTRRSFLDYLIGGSLGVMAVGVIVPVLKYVYSPGKKNHKEREVKAGTVNEVPVGKAKKFDIGGKPGIIVHTRAGFFALSAVCTHLGCIVDWNEEKGQIICPCHNAAFDVKGNIISGPPPKPLPSFEVAVVGEDIMVK